MSTPPADLRQLRAALADWTGLDAAALGIVGNAAHTWGYHLGRDRIYTIPPGRGDRDPSVRHARDRAGLDDNASAIDIGAHARIRALGAYLLSAVLAGGTGTADICELIAERSNGSHIWAWDRAGGVSGVPSSTERPHHLHVSYRRDSRGRDKVALFRTFYEPMEEPMRTLFSTGERLRTFPTGTPYYTSPTATKPAGTITDEHVVYEIVADLRVGDVEAGAVEWLLVDGGGAGRPMRYVRAA